MKIEISINDKIAEFFKRTFTAKKTVAGLFTVIIAGSIAVYAAAPLTIEHTFSQGEIISAEQVNANFSAIKDKVNELNSEIQNITGVSGTFLTTSAAEQRFSEQQAMIASLQATVAGLASGSATIIERTAPIGTIMPFAGSKEKIPAGWILCDGRSLEVNSGNEYFKLFETIGTQWGGNGTNFNIPDMRGRFLRGTDDGQKVDPDAASRTNKTGTATLGDVVGSYQNDAFQKHRHTYGDIYHGGTGEKKTPEFDGHNENAWGYDHERYSWDIYQETGIKYSSETRPKNVSVNYIIKY